jgi:SP family myo-inositol transporter-like MFS transporter 13
MAAFNSKSNSDEKLDVVHYETAPEQSALPDLTLHTGLIVCTTTCLADAQDENLVRADSEDKVTPFLIFIISSAAVAGFLFGYDTGIVGSALPMVGTDLGHALDAQEQEIITAGTTIGAILGALILGVLADRWGRKWCMVIADILYVKARGAQAHDQASLQEQSLLLPATPSAR